MFWPLLMPKTQLTKESPPKTTSKKFSVALVDQMLRLFVRNKQKMSKCRTTSSRLAASLTPTPEDLNLATRYLDIDLAIEWGRLTIK